MQSIIKKRVELNNKTILITGVAGFIGYHLAKRLISASGGICENTVVTEGIGGIGDTVVTEDTRVAEITELTDITIVGVDNMSDYTPVSLKEWRLAELERLVKRINNACNCNDSNETAVKFEFIREDISNKPAVDSIFEEYKPDIVVNLAAQAGVRYSIDNPYSYLDSNIAGFLNILEACRHGNVEHLVYASSSSVYGGNTKVPFSVGDDVDHPVSLYAASKRADELMAHSYSKLYDIPCTGLRFFTAYGPAGRTDMAYFHFADILVNGGIIDVFNYGNCKRDFTYIDDIVEGIYRVLQGAPHRKKGEDGLPIPPYALYNIGGGQPENLLDFINILQEELVRVGLLPSDYDFDAHRRLVPMQPGDVPVTYADSSALERDFGFKPTTDLRTGLRAFVEWYKEYYG